MLFAASPSVGRPALVILASLHNLCIVRKVTIHNNNELFESGNWNEYNLNPLTRIHWRASLVPAAMVNPAPIAYINYKSSNESKKPKTLKSLTQPATTLTPKAFPVRLRPRRSAQLLGVPCSCPDVLSQLMFVINQLAPDENKLQLAYECSRRTFPDDQRSDSIRLASEVHPVSLGGPAQPYKD
uniref:Uncharacterized protein n=1 Tax=Brassica oleracea var. oleracea TaxID=109376 RepID=A0A0D2ZPB9_BRAOL